MDKKLSKRILEGLLFKLSRAILNAYRPQIIGVTGSIGKTSAKEAIYTVLSAKFKVRKNIKNYNNEIGLPLTIIGAASGGQSPLGWLKVFLQAFFLLIRQDKNYPRFLVLEMGADRIGDLKYLTTLAPCKVGVVTGVAPVHLEYFKTLEKIAKEKSVIVSHLPADGWAILNADNQYTAAMAQATKAKVLTYGFGAEAAVRALEINFSQGDSDQLSGISFKLAYDGSTVPVLLPDILGQHLVYAALAGAAVGIAFGMNLVSIAQALEKFKAPNGRMRLIAGIKDTLIIDDTYNASPESMLAAINTEVKIKVSGQKYAVLGDMLELGDFTQAGHEKIGEAVVANGIDYLITVGERARIIADQAQALGMDKDKIFSFGDAIAAARFVQERIKAGDLILIKGSQGMRLEKTVKEIMAEPLRAKELLVRQEAPWI